MGPWTPTIHGQKILARRKRYGTEHFGMKVDKLESALQQCQVAGAKIILGVTQIRPGVRIAFFMAPDNVLVELLETK